MTFDEVGVPALALMQLLENHALDIEAVRRFRAIMAREGTDIRALAQSNGQAPVRWFREVYPDLDSDQSILLGLVFAEQAQLTSFGPLSIPLVSAGSVAEIVELLAYLPVISGALNTQFHRSEDGLAVSFTGNTGDPGLDCLLVTYCGSALQRLIEMLAGNTSTVTLHLSWTAPAELGNDESVETGRLIFDAPISFLHVPPAALNEVCRFSDPITYRVAIADLQQSLDQRSSTESFTSRVRKLLDDGYGLKSSSTIAAELSLSISTLKRRLAEEGTTFRELTESTLLERAALRLLDHSMSVSEVAVSLGYSDLTNFSHAFKRWTGESPTQFRQRRRRPASDPQR